MRPVRRSVPFVLLVIGCGARSSLDLLDASVVTPTVDASLVTPDAPVAARLHVASLALGWDHACAILSDKTARCWGENDTAQLGVSSSLEQSDQAIALTSPTGIAAMSGGYDQTCAVLVDGTLECWGSNNVGESGAGMTAATIPPTVIASGYTSAGAGFDYGCGARTDGTVWCWGASDHDQTGSLGYSRVPVEVAGVQGAAFVSVGEYVSCALLMQGSVRCWGLGPLGDGSLTDSALPVQVAVVASSVTQLAVGGMHACALLEDKSIACWGYGGYGELGLGTSVDTAPEPRTVPGLGPAVSVSSCDLHSCAALQDGTVSCWGNDTAYTPGTFSPATVAGVAGATAVASGDSFDCALLASGKVVCWGDNGAGQLGDGTTTPSATPVLVLGLP